MSSYKIFYYFFTSKFVYVIPNEQGKHFVILDGLRGVAAIAVVFLHIGDILVLPNWLPQAYLAVPFFFVLSGFVIGYAYEADVMTRESAAMFMLIRIRRLYPMFVIGLVISIVTALMKGSLGHPLGAIQLAIQAAAAVTMVPLPGSAAFMLLPPQWSLSIELWGNLLHYALRPLMTVKALSLFIFVALIAMISAAFRFGGLGTGWNMGNLAAGVTTFGFSYGTGVLIARLWRNNRLALLVIPAWCIVALFVLSLIVPQQLRTPANALRDVICAALLFPTILIAALRVDIGSRLGRFANWCGRLSYPVYILHYPIVAACCLALLHFQAPKWTFYIAAPLITGMVIAVSWLLLVIIDEPLRAWMRSRRPSRRRAEPSTDPV